MYPDNSFLDISSTPEGNTNIRALQLNLSLNLSPPEEMLHQLLTAVSECRGLSRAPAATSGCFTLHSQKSDSSVGIGEANVQGKPLVRALQTHPSQAGKGSSGQQTSSHSRETIPVTPRESRSRNIDGSSETHLKLAWGPGILQFTSVLP